MPEACLGAPPQKKLRAWPGWTFDGVCKHKAIGFIKSSQSVQPVSGIGEFMQNSMNTLDSNRPHRIVNSHLQISLSQAMSNPFGCILGRVIGNVFDSFAWILNTWNLYDLYYLITKVCFCVFLMEVCVRTHVYVSACKSCQLSCSNTVFLRQH